MLLQQAGFGYVGMLGQGGLLLSCCSVVLPDPVGQHRVHADEEGDVGDDPPLVLCQEEGKDDTNQEDTYLEYDDIVCLKI